MQFVTILVPALIFHWFLAAEVVTLEYPRAPGQLILASTLIMFRTDRLRTPWKCPSFTSGLEFLSTHWRPTETAETLSVFLTLLAAWFGGEVDQKIKVSREKMDKIQPFTSHKYRMTIQ